MSRKQGILVLAAVFLILSLMFFILFSERGLADLNQMTKERDRLSSQNRQVIQENIGLGVEIDRLKNDPSYIESVARREFGMIGPDEIVVKPQRPPDR
jgi:cell division protein FtsB